MYQVVSVFVFSSFVSCFSLPVLIGMFLYLQFFFLLVFLVSISLVIILSVYGVRRLCVIIAMFICPNSVSFVRELRACPFLYRILMSPNWILLHIF